MNIGKFGNDVRRLFHIDPSKVLWMEYLIAFGKITIDIIALEDIIKEHPEYDDDKSFSENVMRMYGKEAHDWLLRMISKN